jgi:hypothetical protein
LFFFFFFCFQFSNFTKETFFLLENVVPIVPSIVLQNSKCFKKFNKTNKQTTPKKEKKLNSRRLPPFPPTQLFWDENRQNNTK